MKYKNLFENVVCETIAIILSAQFLTRAPFTNID